jgi:hypothetical protein
MPMNRGPWTLICLLLLPVTSPAAPAIDDQAVAQAILDKAIKAVGGREKLSNVTSLVEKASSAGWTRTIYCELPGRWRVEAEGSSGLERFTILFELDDEPGWSLRIGPARERPEKEITSYKEMWRDDLVVWPLLFFKDNDHKLSTFAASKVGDHAAVGVKVSRKGGPDIKLYFDRDSGLLLKRESEQVQPAPPGEKPPPPIIEEILYKDYKELSGIKYPTKKTTRRDKQITSEEEVTEFKIVEKFDEKTFAKPQ